MTKHNNNNHTDAAANVAAVIVREYDQDGPSHLRRTTAFNVGHSDASIIAEESSSRTGSSSSSSLRRLCKDLFLPLGFPDSFGSAAVANDYLRYQLYDSIQALCSYLRDVAATSAILEAAGVGNASATAWGAGLTWALRDGIGLIGGLTFSFVASDYFDSHVKEFRLLADISNDVGMTLDMLGPYVASGSSNDDANDGHSSSSNNDGKLWLFMLLATSTLCKTICGIAAGATKGRITQHFARRGNMADLTAKEGTQETLVNLLGMIGGIWLAHAMKKMEQDNGDNVDDDADVHWRRRQQMITWSIFLFLTIVHVWANYKGVLVLKLRSLNRPRARLALSKVVVATESKGVVDQVPRPDDVLESLVESTIDLLFPKIVTSDRTFRPEWYLATIHEFRDCQYIIGCDEHRHRLHILLRVGATTSDEIRAFAHGMVLSKWMAHRSKHGNDTGTATSSWNADLIRRSLSRIRSLFDCDDNNLIESMTKRGWEMEPRAYLGFSQYRIDWSNDNEDDDLLKKEK